MVARVPAYSWMIVKVGLDTSSAGTPAPRARPRTKAVFPAPRSPCSSTRVAGARRRPSASPACSVSVSLAVLTFDAAARGQLEYGVAEPRCDVGWQQRRFPFVGLREVA